MAQVINKRKSTNVPLGDDKYGINNNIINHQDETSEDYDSEEDNGILSRLLSPRKSIDKQNYFSIIPDEIYSIIFQYLDLESLCKAGFVCKTWNDISNDKCIWTQRIEDKFGAIETSKIEDKKRWFLYKLCIESHYKDIKNMDPAAKLDFSFEERLFYNQISFRTWGVALKLLHSPLQNNFTIGAIIVQTILIYLKLDKIIHYPWFFIFMPMWTFNTFYICSCVVWFYLHARDLLTEEFVEKRLSGWLKDVLDALRTRFLDHLLFILVSCSIFMMFPLLLVLQLDVFSQLFVQNNNQSNELYFKPYRLPWTVVAFPLLLGFGITWLSIRRRIRYNKRRRHLRSLPLLHLLWFVFLWAFVLVLVTALQLDGLVPSFWNCYWSAIPVWLLDLSALAYFAGVFNFNPANGRWQRSFDVSA
eukprot:TRINITY_DN4523_c0_g1_i1.p1 TRINITY_DN4523_c0_g1~~TRINITY_DN4523_c0_g1_i1.p1  ORF type:complete len:417 (-),score=49.16 TRINITY_DN4523_c0_g1_i1:75-1325(-)